MGADMDFLCEANISTGFMSIVGAIVNWIGVIATILFLVGLPICLVLLIFRKTRGQGGMGIYFLSWPVGLWLWLNCALYALSVSVFWTIIGILAGGLGIIPIAVIMTLIRRDWVSFGNLMGTLIIVLILRYFGLWIFGRAAEKREQEKAYFRAEAET